MVLVLAVTLGTIITTARIRKCTSNKRYRTAVQGNRSGESCNVDTVTNPIHSCNGDETSPHTSMQDIKLTPNEAYIPVEPNQCFSVDPDPLYASVEETGETQYDYIDPY